MSILKVNSQKKSVTFQNEDDRNNFLETLNKPADKSKFSTLNTLSEMNLKRDPSSEKVNNDSKGIEMPSPIKLPVTQDESRIFDFKNIDAKLNETKSSSNTKPPDNPKTPLTTIFSILKKEMSKEVSTSEVKQENTVPAAKQVGDDYLRQFSTNQIQPISDNIYRVGELSIKKDWLMNKPIDYDQGLLNAFYLIDLKKNMRRVLEKEPENILKLNSLQAEISGIVEKNKLPRIMNPPISQNDLDSYTFNDGSKFFTHKLGKVLGMNHIREVKLDKNGLKQTKNEKSVLKLSSLTSGRIEDKDMSSMQSDGANQKKHKNNELDWPQSKKTQPFQYRLIIDDPNHTKKKSRKLALYLSEYRDAQKLKDYGIVSSLIEEKKDIERDFFKQLARKWKSHHAYKIYKLMLSIVDQIEKKRQEEKKQKEEEADKRRKQEEERERKRKKEEEMRRIRLSKNQFLQNSEVLAVFDQAYLNLLAKKWLNIALNHEKKVNMMLSMKNFQRDTPVTIIFTLLEMRIEHPKYAIMKPALLFKLKMKEKNQLLAQFSQSKSVNYSQKNESPQSQEMVFDLKLTSFSENSSKYMVYGQRFNPSPGGNEFVLPQVILNQDFLNGMILLKVFDDISHQEMGKIELNVAKIIDTVNWGKDLTVFIDMESNISKQGKAFLHIQTFVKNKEVTHSLQNFDEYFRELMTKQDFVKDPFFGKQISLGCVTPREFPYLLSLLEKKNLPVEELKILALKETSSKIFSSLRYSFFKYYIECIGQVIAKSFKNLQKWFDFQEKVLGHSFKEKKPKEPAANTKKSPEANKLRPLSPQRKAFLHKQSTRSAIELMEIEKLDASDEFIKQDSGIRSSMPTLRNSSKINDRLSQKRSTVKTGKEEPTKKRNELTIPGIKEEEMERSMEEDNNDEDDGSSRVVASIFYKRNLWEKNKRWRFYYEILQGLSKEGIPFQIRESIYMELGQVKKWIYKTEEMLLIYKKEILLKESKISQEEQEAFDLRKFLFETVLTEGKLFDSVLFQQFYEDYDFYKKTTQQSLNMHQSTIISNIFEAFIMWITLFNEKRVCYSKHLISICRKILYIYECDYLSKNVSIPEENVFWILVIIVNCIMKNYYSINEFDEIQLKYNSHENILKNNESKGKLLNPIPYVSLLQGGIKADMKILGLIVKEHLPEIFEKIEELEMPIDFYFADNVLSMFSDLFNEELMFRVWDILFLEGSSDLEIKTSWVLISICYLILERNKELILKAKTAKDLQYILKTYGLFELDIDNFIVDVYKIMDQFFSQEKNDETENCLGKIKFVGEKIYNKIFHFNIPEEIVNYEKILSKSEFLQLKVQNLFCLDIIDSLFSSIDTKSKSHFQNFQSYKRFVYAIPNFIMNHDPNILKARDRSFHEDFLSTNDSIQNNLLMSFRNISGIRTEDEKSFVIPTPRTIHIYVHSILINHHEEIELRLTYAEQNKVAVVDPNQHLKIYEVFNYISGVNIMRLELYKNEYGSLILTKYVDLDIGVYQQDVVYNFWTPVIDSLKIIENHFQEELLMSLLINSGSTCNRGITSDNQKKTEENNLYDINLKPFQNSLELKKEEFFFKNIIHGSLQFDKNEWRANSHLSLEEFANLMKILIGNNEALNHYYISAMFKAFSNEGLGKFYMIDMLLAILFLFKISFVDKMCMAFDILSFFESRVIREKVSTRAIRRFTKFLYDRNLIWITQENVDGIMDELLDERSPMILKAKMILNNSEASEHEMTKVFKVLTKILKQKKDCKDICFEDPAIIKHLHHQMNKVVGVELENCSGKLMIKYQTNTSKKNFFINFIINEGRLLFYPQKNDIGLIADKALGGKIDYIKDLFEMNDKILTLSNEERLLSKLEFVDLMFKLPMLSHFSSLYANLNRTVDFTEAKRKFEVKLRLCIDEKEVLNMNINECPRKKLAKSIEDIYDNIEKKNEETVFVQEWLKYSKLLSSPLVSSITGTDNSFIYSQEINIDLEYLSLHEVFRLVIKKVMFKLVEVVLTELNNQITKCEKHILGSIDPGIVRLYSKLNNIDFLKEDYELIDLEINEQAKIDTERIVLSYYGDNKQNMPAKPRWKINFKSRLASNLAIKKPNYIAIYRFHDLSKIWLPCKVLYQIKKEQNQKANYAVLFERYPQKIFVKDEEEIIEIYKSDDKNEFLQSYRGEITRKELIKEGLKMQSPDREDVNGEEQTNADEEVVSERPIMKFNENLLSSVKAKRKR